MSKGILLIDGDTVAFHAALGKTVFGDPRSFDDAITSVEEHIAFLKSYLQVDNYQVLLSDPKANFRKDVFPSYKSNRVGQERPPLIDQLKDYLREEHLAYHEDRLEADDLQGILATTPGDTSPIIVSIDKDLRQIPGRLFNPNKYQEGIVNITREQGLEWKFAQAVLGDTTDGYPGVPGVGPKKQEKAFAEFLKDRPVDDLWEVVLELFKRHSLDESYALMQIRCAHILQSQDYNWGTKEIRLWTP